jgi:uncharacterized protein (TIGR01777 family)
MRVVITGGSGLIGRELTRDLASSGVEVVVLSRSPESIEGLPAGAVAEAWDADSPRALVERIEGADAVVNLAGENIGGGRWTAARKRAIRDSRVRVTEAVAEALRLTDRRPLALVQASAVGFYGAAGDELLTEQEPAGSDFLAAVCREWEQASSIVETFGVRRVVVRTGVVLDGTGGALPRILLPFRLFVGGKVGDGRQWFPWIHIRDEVRAIRFLLEREVAGVFNLTAPEPVRNHELAAKVGRALSRPSVLPAPALALRLALGEMSTLLLDGQRAVPRGLLDLGFTFEFPSLDDALRDLLGK